MNVATVEPEREMIRRVMPYVVPAMAVALVLGLVIGGWSPAWSALAGVMIVALNFVASGLSQAWAARISPTILFAVAMGGFVLRLAIILGVMALLNTLAWFSPVAFLAAVVPATLALLVFEGKQLSGRMQVDLWAVAAKEARR